MKLKDFAEIGLIMGLIKTFQKVRPAECFDTFALSL